MRNYLFSILTVSLAAALLFHLLPEKASLKKGVQFLSVLLLLSLLLSPFLAAKDDLAEFFSGDWLPNEELLKEEYREESDRSLLSYSKDYIETLVKERLIKSFSLREGDLRVNLILEGDEPKKVLLLLSGKAIWQDSAKLEAYVTSLVGLPCSSAIE